MHNLPHQLLTSSEIREHFNVFAPEDSDVGVFEDTAGFLVPELCIRAFLTMATRQGATLHFGETVTGDTPLPVPVIHILPQSLRLL